MYLRQVEEVIIRALATVTLDTHRVEGLTGVWHTRTDGTRVKLASIGVHARDWVTWHGVALNVENDLSTFDHTVPCGIDGVTMSTVARECALRGLAVPGVDTINHAVATATGEVFALSVSPLPETLQTMLMTQHAI